MTVREPYLLVDGAFADEAAWARIIRHGRCADGSLDPDQWGDIGQYGVWGGLVAAERAAWRRRRWSA